MLLNRLAARSIRRSDTLFQLAERAAFLRFKTEINRGAVDGGLRLHLGCGPRLLDGWINVDMLLEPGVLTARLPQALTRFPSRSARFIYASHVLEHIEYPREANSFAQECHRLLVDGGVLRIVVPGIERIIRAYVADDGAFFDIQSSIHPPECTTKLEHLMFALQQHGEHKYGYDFETMSKLLHGVGFETIVESDYNASAFEELRIDYRRLTDNQGRYLSLYVDAIR